MTNLIIFLFCFTDLPTAKPRKQIIGPISNVSTPVGRDASLECFVAKHSEELRVNLFSDYETGT